MSVVQSAPASFKNAREADLLHAVHGYWRGAEGSTPKSSVPDEEDELLHRLAKALNRIQLPRKDDTYKGDVWYVATVNGETICRGVIPLLGDINILVTPTADMPGLEAPPNIQNDHACYYIHLNNERISVPGEATRPTKFLVPTAREVVTTIKTILHEDLVTVILAVEGASTWTAGVTDAAA